MEFKKVSIDEEKRSLLDYALSFYDDSDDIFPEFSFNPLSSVTDEIYQDSLKFFENEQHDDNITTFSDNIIRCQTIYSMLYAKNEINEIQIEPTDFPLFNTYLLRNINSAIALSKIYRIDPKTLLLYGFIYSNVYSQYVASDKNIYKKHLKLFVKPIKKMFKQAYSFIYSNKMSGVYCDSFLR